MKRVHFLLYSPSSKPLDWRSQDKYRELGEAFEAGGLEVITATWTGENLEALETELRDAQAVLVWVNPIHRDVAMGRFEAMLTRLTSRGIQVSALPSAVEKIGTKEILAKLSGTAWVPQALAHTSVASILTIETQLREGRTRVVKQHRGNDGLGVYKLERAQEGGFVATEANTGELTRGVTFPELVRALFSDTEASNPVIEMPWNPNLVNGIVRCYFCVDQVAGFGYQEVNALYPNPLPPQIKKQRFYLTENCGVFQTLRQRVESDFIETLIERTGVKREDLPIIWDADFFINDLAANDFSLCEINASCVSPFPPSAIHHMVQRVEEVLSLR